MFIILPIRVFAIASIGVSIDVTPTNPAPYEDAIIALKSYEYNLDSVLISWSVNDKVITSGIGKKSLSTKTPAVGVDMNVVATISLPDGVIERKITIKPSVMVLLWQANDSYVPPFYRGKALPTADSEVKVVAMPELRSESGNVSAQNMTYYWKNNYTNNVDGSGYGKNYFTYISDYLEDSNTISATASTIDQKYSSNADVKIGTNKPKILFYKNDSKLGTIWQNALTNTHKIQGEEIIEASPYFISPKELLTPSLVWSWSINDSPITLTSFRKNLMPIKVGTGIHGTSKLTLNIENKTSLFQAVSKEITIEF